MKKNSFSMIDENGKEVVYDVLFTFESEETNKNYIVYTDNKVDEVTGNIEVYADCGELNKYSIELEQYMTLYKNITNELNGQVINIEAGGIHHINLFDIDDSYGDNPLADKEDMILSVCSLMQKEKLTAGQRTTVSMVISEIYKLIYRIN